MLIPITPINSKGAIPVYWLKCICRCQTRVESAAEGKHPAQPCGVRRSSRQPGKNPYGEVGA